MDATGAMQMAETAQRTPMSERRVAQAPVGSAGESGRNFGWQANAFNVAVPNTESNFKYEKIGEDDNKPERLLVEDEKENIGERSALACTWAQCGRVLRGAVVSVSNTRVLSPCVARVQYCCCRSGDGPPFHQCIHLLAGKRVCGYSSCELRR